MPAPSPIKTDRHGACLYVHLTPKSSQDRIDGLKTIPDGGIYLKIRVRAVPEKNQANQALIKRLSKSIGVPVSTLAIASGPKNRAKIIRLIGPPDASATKLQRWLKLLSLNDV